MKSRVAYKARLRMIMSTKRCGRPRLTWKSIVRVCDY